MTQLVDLADKQNKYQGYYWCTTQSSVRVVDTRTFEVESGVLGTQLLLVTVAGKYT